MTTVSTQIKQKYYLTDNRGDESQNVLTSKNTVMMWHFSQNWKVPESVFCIFIL